MRGSRTRPKGEVGLTYARVTRSSREDSEENLSPGPPASVFWSGTLGTRATDGDNETSSLSLRWRVLFGGGDRHARRGSRFVIIPRDLLANPPWKRERERSLFSLLLLLLRFSFLVSFVSSPRLCVEENKKILFR